MEKESDKRTVKPRVQLPNCSRSKLQAEAVRWAEKAKRDSKLFDGIKDLLNYK